MPTRTERANAIRALSMDAIERANSGHPGAPMGMADMAEVLWNDFLRHNPANPQWVNRDRFVLSNGHASMLLYSVLHLTGYDLSMDDIKNFRQLGSKTPGHPELGVTPGVEATTGPLGQGLAMAVGMALSEKILAAEFNRDGFPVVDHHTYVFLGEGCLMEGVSSEASSFAGTQGLGKLICLFDKNGISIDGKVEGWFTENVAARYKAYGWQVIDNVDGHDPLAVKRAIAKARKDTARPSLICCTTVIGYGAPTKAGTAKTHGSPLGAEEIAGARKALGWNYEPFTVPDAVKKSWDARRKGKAAEKAWEKLFEAYAAAHPELAGEFSRRMRNELPSSWVTSLAHVGVAAFKAGESVATRVALRNVLNGIMPDGLPGLLGGAADLTPSVNTQWNGAKLVTAESPNGQYIAYGVREFAMGAVMNGIALHGGFIPYGGTFLVFSDYARGAIRLAALMKLRVIWVLTHDSIGVGEDGPTHQPVEHVPSLRLIPGLRVWRPCDAVETVVAWKCAVDSENAPSCLILSRQNLPMQKRTMEQGKSMERGAYVLYEPKGAPQGIIIATGSEVAIAVEAAQAMEKRGRKIRVVSMPCAEVFETQDKAWKESVLPSSIRARVAVEAAASDWWTKYVGLDGIVIGMNSFGESAPGGELFTHFGFTAEHVMKAMESLL
ncbi:transketolase 2, thiamin-binding [uncultured delta proteobacterium]|uniref:Transketolase n=1 Tax=uncultured delta proteobacterium TaxID=34034 RepID=A0A212JUZ2_9DELT|nr:transketolase 2, thiamin-binding [uncultured delta proteobacterium]